MRLTLRFVTCIICFGLMTSLSGCASTPLADRYAKRYQADLQYYQGSPFIHAVFLNNEALARQNSHNQRRLLHVYIEGDGLPFHSPDTAADPTPSNPLMLKLMQQDSHPSIYLARPCYYQTQDPECGPVWWTLNRYHQTVVDSMVSVLEQFQDLYDGFVVIGYNGGGTLAMLMSERYPKIKTLVTVAGNLNHTEWTLKHGYSPLMGSENPANHPSLPARLIQIHYAGEHDQIIEAEWIKAVVDKQIRAEFHVIPDFDHSCCWEKFWPNVLKKLSQYRAYTR